MEATELRIGNWVNFKFGNKESDVMICWNDLRNFEMNIKLDRFNDIYKPIPLTEEWLLKFGFKKTDDTCDFVYWELDNLTFCDVLPDNLELINYELSPCKHVHQLQNLYFALTNKELELK